MPTTKRLTIAMPSETAAAIKQAVDDGEYASASEVVREALREWKMHRQLRLNELSALQADIGQGLADAAAGRVKAFDVDRIIPRGKQLLALRSC